MTQKNNQPERSDNSPKNERSEKSFPSLEQRLKSEKETREGRLEYLRAEVEGLFPGNELVELREDIERSLNVPQFGNYHNEGMLMDTHLFKALEVIEQIKNGAVLKDVPEYLAEIMRDIVKEHEVAIKQYVFLHDISKADSLRLRFNDDTEDKDITWEEWEDMIPAEIRTEPQALSEFLRQSNIQAISYFHENETHGSAGANKIEKYKEVINIPPMVQMIVRRHESAHHFAKVKADTCKSFFKGFSPEEEAWVQVASYIDTMASLSPDGTPNLKSFTNMVGSINNFRLAEIVEKVLSEDGRIANGLLTKKLAGMRRTSEVITDSPKELLDSIRRECVAPVYNKELVQRKLAEIQISFGDQAELVSTTVADAIDSEGHLNSSVYGQLIKVIGSDKLNLVKSILEVSEERQDFTTRQVDIGSKDLFSSRLTQKYINIEVFSAKLESRELTQEVKAELFFEAFAGSGVTEKLRMLDAKGILEELIPEFANNRHLTQDERFHGLETVGDHLFRSVEQMDESIGQAGAFSNPRFEMLLRMTAFMHDIGKNEDEEKSPETTGKEGRGYRVTTRKKGEDFDRVRFLGHQSEGEDIFRSRIAEIQNVLTDEKKLSEEEILMVSIWIRDHMRAINATRDLRQSSAEELAEQVIRDIYPIDLLNARVPLDDVVRANLMMQEQELMLSLDSANKTQWINGWNELREEVERQLPILRIENKRRLLIPLATGADLVAFGVQAKKRAEILEELERMQMSGEVVNRNGALLAVLSLAQDKGIKINASKFDELAGKGAYDEMRARKENIKVVLEEDRGTYTWKKYETTPIRQFTEESTLEEIGTMVFSGNFPNLASHMERFGISVADLKEIILERGFANLLQIEFFVKEHCVDGETLANVAITHSPNIKMAEINRVLPNGNQVKILVNNGYQSTKDHTGFGYIHIGEQRIEALKRFYQTANENEDDLVKRFFEEAIVNVAGNAVIQIPSDYDPTVYSILLAPVKNHEDRFFAGVIIDQKGDRSQVITTLFQESPKQLRVDIKNMLRRLKERAGFTAEQLEPYFKEINNLFKTVDLQDLDFEQLERQKEDGAKKEKSPKKETVEIPDILKPLGRVLRNKLKDVASVFPELVANRDNPEQITIKLRDELGLNEAQISEVVSFLNNLRENTSK